VINADMPNLIQGLDLKSDGHCDLVSSSPIVSTISHLYPECERLYGPYTRKDKRKFYTLYDGINRRAILVARLLLELKLGRRLIHPETVDHRDEDKTNDDPDNLRILSNSDNSRSAHTKIIYGICKFCKVEFLLSHEQRSTRGRAKSGPYCSSDCHNNSMRTRS